MIYGAITVRDAPPSIQAPATAEEPMALFSVTAPDSIDRSPVDRFTTGHHLFEAKAPRNEGTVDARLMFDADPSIVAGTVPVGSSVQQLPPRTVSAGAETVTNSRRFDLPLIGNGWAYRLIRGPIRSTMLAPELQSELDDTGRANVMPVRQMTPAVQVLAPAPWYETYLKTIGR